MMSRQMYSENCKLYKPCMVCLFLISTLLSVIPLLFLFIFLRIIVNKGVKMFLQVGAPAAITERIAYNIDIVVDI